MSNIKVGDLVMVVKPSPCCGQAHLIGHVFIAQELTSAIYVQCTFCGKIKEQVDSDYVGEDDGFVIEKSRLKKIDLLSDPESITKDEEVPA